MFFFSCYGVTVKNGMNHLFLLFSVTLGHIASIWASSVSSTKENTKNFKELQRGLRSHFFLKDFWKSSGCQQHYLPSHNNSVTFHHILPLMASPFLGVSLIFLTIGRLIFSYMCFELSSPHMIVFYLAEILCNFCACDGNIYFFSVLLWFSSTFLSLQRLYNGTRHLYSVCNLIQFSIALYLWAVFFISSNTKPALQ